MTWDPDAVEGQPERVTYNFYGAVYAPGSTFGEMSDRPCAPDWRLRHTTGALRDDEVLATVSNYVRPSSFEEAVRQLRRSHVIVLAGAPGSGRRAGALALLREVTDGLIVTLSPAVTAHDLAAWDYVGRHGYVVIDSDEIDSRSHVSWADIAARLQRTGTYLVVTTTGTWDPTAPVEVPQLRWERPSIAEVLHGHLANNWSKDDVDKLVDLLLPRLPADCTLRWLACLARLVNARRDPEQALQDMQEMCGRQVNRWFDQPPSSPEMIAVAAAAFLAGASEATYRSQLARLEQLLADRQPFRHRRDSQAGSASGQLPSVTPGEGLLRVRHVVSRAGAGPVVCFRKGSYQRFALARIWDTSERWFRQAVREWIDGMVNEPERLRVAPALSLLACSNFDEVNGYFLDPWSRGELGWPGKVLAAYVLWCMCRDETTAPVALRTAVRWSDHGDAEQRTAAMIAFGGELGISYPTDAARGLWRLMTQAEDLPVVSVAALGRLFAVLVDQTREAGAVLTMLDTQRARFCRVESRHRLARITVAAARAVLMVRSHRTGQPAIAEFMLAEPDWLEMVARLWASLIRSRPDARSGLTALWDTLSALQDLSGDPVLDARALGRALAGTLLDSERSQLKADLIRLDREVRPSGYLAVDVLLAFVRAIGHERLQD